MNGMTIDLICDFIIIEATKYGKSLNQMKLQKLLYYSDAWYIAFFKKPLFEEKFQAWIHGPISPQVYDRFANSKDLYSMVTKEDVSGSFSFENIPKPVKTHIRNTLKVYHKFSGSELEEMSHQEGPWIKAREGYGPTQSCKVELDKEFTGKYYAARLK